MSSIHNETREERLNAIEHLIEDYKYEIELLESEQMALLNGGTSLRSLGLDRKMLYPLWRAGFRTVADVEGYIKEHLSLIAVHGLGKKYAAVIAAAIEKARSLPDDR